MNAISKLHELRTFNGEKRRTEGLPDDVIERFLELDPNLQECIDRAYAIHKDLRKEYENVLKLDEQSQIETLQKGYLNFYNANTVNPYVPLAGSGPWLVSTCGAVIHDSGGYGMLGWGQSPKPVLEALAGDYVMANVMTASFSQERLMSRLHREIGLRRKGDLRHPFSQFICMNSGSESVSVASRIVDINAKLMTDPGGRHAGKKIRALGHVGGFHGRTCRPSQVSDSTHKAYMVMATFRDYDHLITVKPNDCESLRAAFKKAEADNIFLEAFYIEPVMGEGNPGCQVTPEFYKLARELTAANGTLLICDSIQAGLRTQGVLSICDYPGFEMLPAPDMETYSKALNGGQYPLSVLALSQLAANLYKPGVYGNTMTTNPRALEVACATLDQMTEDVRKNIVERGKEFVTKLKQVQQDIPDAIKSVEGTGLLFAAELNPQRFTVVAKFGTETYLRTKGIGVIHGGSNALRFTPHFRITSAEVDLIVDAVRDALLNGPKAS